MFVGHAIKRDAHDAEGLRQVVDDAVEKNFLFLDFALKTFVIQK